MCKFCEERQKISWESNRDICQIGNFSIDRHYYNNTLFADRICIGNVKNKILSVMW